jgi:hypothetical protein
MLATASRVYPSFLVLKRAVPMRGEDGLAARVRACLAGVDGVSEMKMFGGVGFMLNGNMLAGTSKRGLLLRVGRSVTPRRSPSPACGRWSSAAG